MPIPLPVLDDRTYADLVAEARALLPHLAPGWTDHNPGDPGIVLVELLAFLTELLLFQVDEIPGESTVGFLKLLNGRDSPEPAPVDLDRAVGDTLARLRERYRAVTPGDYEHHVRHTWPGSDEARGLGGGDAAAVARVGAVARRNLEAATPEAQAEEAPAHVSLVVVPPRPAVTPPSPVTGAPPPLVPEPGDALRAALAAFLAPRRTLTTRVHVVGPAYVRVGVQAHLALAADAPADTAADEVFARLATHLDPLVGGPDGTGWPFGRDLYLSDVYAVVERAGLVDYAEQVTVTSPDRRLVATEGHEVGLRLDDHELLRFTGLDAVVHDVNGNRSTTSRSTS
jgi:hypothetical protein